ncbi:DUF305 domain-containing protein [Chamaesiphon minutus]|jgi:uncharacterized protein (DUF305 family)|uniref:DUF305 domain-containing protein n=1 Tax=Chamaesiphon minutus (strain ATCC 27169 / PCC 6605) TaxID=1173020 RepID=K9UQ13_CHAP6|nr:DUF305 domain-containing protein [Chamaesiphon minutus]AFY97172.1 hypothetical protein Cha6605_6349 [Chamaesiphon minutus PCC 6605]
MTERNNQAKSSIVGKASPVENRRTMANPVAVPPKIWGGLAIAAIFLSGGLASCADRTAQSPSTTDTTPTTDPSVSSSPNSSSQTISDRDFLTMMTAHHKQALEMADLALTRAKRPEIEQLARSIIKDQKSEIQTMAALYKTAYGTEIPAMAMGGGMMGKDANSMNGMNGMSGMKMDMNALKNAADFDKEFLQQMSVHHRTAAQMSQMVLQTTKSPEIRTLAQSIVKAQTAEIGQMQKWYQTWYKAAL